MLATKVFNQRKEDVLVDGDSKEAIVTEEPVETNVGLSTNTYLQIFREQIGDFSVNNTVVVREKNFLIQNHGNNDLFTIVELVDA